MSDTRRYRGQVGPVDHFDLAAATTFSLLAHLGLREYHSLLDVGCGCLRVGRLLIPYLEAGNYCGIEPNQRLIEAGIECEIGRELVTMKSPRFDTGSAFDLGVFGQAFDYILLHSIWVHASEQQVLRCLEGAKAHLKPDGMLIASYVPGRKDTASAEWNPGGIRYRPETLIKMAAGCGLYLQRIQWPHPGVQKWVVVTHVPCRLIALVEGK